MSDEVKFLYVYMLLWTDGKRADVLINEAKKYNSDNDTFGIYGGQRKYECCPKKLNRIISGEQV